MRRVGMSRAEIAAALHRANDDRCNPAIGCETTGCAYSATVENTWGSATAGGAFAFSAAVTKTCNNNASSDGTADDFGGTGHLVNQNESNLFTDPANYDLTLKAGSALIEAGKDLSGAGVTADILGVARPQGAAFDIGSFEYVAAPAAPGMPAALSRRNRFASMGRYSP